MKALVAGAGGQVGVEMTRLDAPDFRVSGLDRAALDIADAAQVARALDLHAPDIVINCAAYTAVDRAEDDSAQAFAVNAEAVGRLGACCAARGVGIVHFSTDYVFDGEKTGAYAEDDAPRPLGVYGASKLAGEEALREAAPRHVILRVSWVFGRLRRSFVDTILRLAREREELTVVDDQVGAPSPASAIAETVRRMAFPLLERDDLWGTYHFSTTPAVSWCGFAREIVREAVAAGRLPAAPPVRPIGADEWPSRAARPRNSRLDASRLRRSFGIDPPGWRPALREYLESLRAPV